jgi:hypothetical protein
MNWLASGRPIPRSLDRPRYSACVNAALLKGPESHVPEARQTGKKFERETGIIDRADATEIELAAAIPKSKTEPEWRPLEPGGDIDTKAEMTARQARAGVEWKSIDRVGRIAAEKDLNIHGVTVGLQWQTMERNRKTDVELRQKERTARIGPEWRPIKRKTQIDADRKPIECSELGAPAPLESNRVLAAEIMALIKLEKFYRLLINDSALKRLNHIP